jgi:glycosyltransferase involved in cell wall biosynthesis
MPSAPLATTAGPLPIPQEKAPREPTAPARVARRTYRIAFIGGRGVGREYSGIETFYEEVGKRLVARGHELTVYCRPHFGPESDRYLGMRIRVLPAPRSKHFETLVHSGLSVLDSSIGPYDVVHLHAIGSSVFAWLPRLFGRRTVVTVHALDWQRPKWKWIARQCLRLAEWTSVKLPNRTTAVSHAVADHLRQRYHVPVTPVPNGVATPVETDARSVRDLGLEPRGFVLFAGRLSEEKRCHLLIDAFQRIERDDLRLVIAGGATYASSYERSLRAMAGPRVVFLGWMDQRTLTALYAHCLLFVLPSSLEGLSVALLEAMAAGAPVLVSDIAPNREAVGQAGWTFRTDDAYDLRRRLSDLLAAPDLLERGGRRAREHVRRSYSWELVVDYLERLYDEMHDAEH